MIFLSPIHILQLLRNETLAQALHQTLSEEKNCSRISRFDKIASNTAPPMDIAKKNVALLSACQALLLVNNSVLITVNGLAGYALATDKALATLPVMSYFLGSAL